MSDRLKGPLLLFLIWGSQVQMLSACSVCFSSHGKERVAYYGTTLFLMLLPPLICLGLIGAYQSALRKKRENPEASTHSK